MPFLTRMARTKLFIVMQEILYIIVATFWKFRLRLELFRLRVLMIKNKTTSNEFLALSLVLIPVSPSPMPHRQIYPKNSSLVRNASKKPPFVQKTTGKRCRSAMQSVVIKDILADPPSKFATVPGHAPAHLTGRLFCLRSPALRTRVNA